MAMMAIYHTLLFNLIYFKISISYYFQKKKKKKKKRYKVDSFFFTQTWYPLYGTKRFKAQIHIHSVHCWIGFQDLHPVTHGLPRPIKQTGSDAPPSIWNICHIPSNHTIVLCPCGHHDMSLTKKTFEWFMGSLPYSI